MDAALGYTEEAFPALPPYLHLLGARRELLGQLKQAALPASHSLDALTGGKRRLAPGWYRPSSPPAILRRSAVQNRGPWVAHFVKKLSF